MFVAAASFAVKIGTGEGVFGPSLMFVHECYRFIKTACYAPGSAHLRLDWQVENGSPFCSTTYGSKQCSKVDKFQKSAGAAKRAQVLRNTKQKAPRNLPSYAAIQNTENLGHQFLTTVGIPIHFLQTSEGHQDSDSSVNPNPRLLTCLSHEE